MIPPALLHDPVERALPPGRFPQSAAKHADPDERRQPLGALACRVYRELRGPGAGGIVEVPRKDLDEQIEV